MYLHKASKWIALLGLMIFSLSLQAFAVKSWEVSPVKKTTTSSSTTKVNNEKAKTEITGEDEKSSTKEEPTKEKTKKTKSENEKNDKEKNCKIIEVKKKCEEGDECPSGENIEKEKVCTWDEDKLPNEVKNLYQQIAKKYGKGSKGTVEYNGSLYNNSSIIYGAVAMKELKDWIQSIDNEVKINFELARLSNMSIGGIDIDGLKGYTPNVRSAKSYLTSAMYVKTVKVLEALYKLSGQAESAQRIAEQGNGRLSGMQMLLDYGLAYGIVLQENAATYWNENDASKALIKQYAWNGWAFQIVNVCNMAYGHSLEQKTWVGIYLNGYWVGGMAQFYAVAPEAIGKAMNNAYDKQCISKEWVKNFTNTPELLIKLWKSHQQIDPERANYLRTTLFVGSSNESQLLTYLGRELQWMFQFYNFSAFMANKLWSRYSLSPEVIARNVYQFGNYGAIKKNLDTINSWMWYSKEDWVNDVKEWMNFAKKGYQWNVNFTLQSKWGNAFPASSPAMRFTSEKNYAEFIAFHLAWAIGAKYNGVAYKNIFNNPYVNKIPLRSLSSWLWLPESCGQIVWQVGKDGWPVVQRKGFNQQGGMYVQVRSYLGERYHIPLNNAQNDGYLKMQKWAFKKLWITNAVLSCFQNGSVVF